MCNSMNRNQLEKRQRDWAYAYKSLMDAPRIRQKVIKAQDQLGFYYLHHSPGNDIARRGTLVETEGFELGTGHYMAYFLDPDDVAVVYDPAAPTSQFGPADVSLLKSRISQRLGKKVIFWPYHHQINGRGHDDTWCQTWTAAFLDNSLRSYLPHSDVTFEEAKTIMHKLVFIFSNRLSQAGYIEAAKGFFLNDFFQKDVFKFFYQDRPRPRTRR